MKFKIPYKCILYEEGDTVFPKFPDENSKSKTIIGTRLDVLGSGTVTQFLRFADEENDLNVSNLYVPYGERTRTKYAEGLVYFESFENGKIITSNKTKVVHIEKKKTTTKPVQNEITFKGITKTP